MRRKPSLGQIMACRLLSEPMLNWTLGNKFQWNLKQNPTIFIQWNAMQLKLLSAKWWIFCLGLCVFIQYSTILFWGMKRTTPPFPGMGITMLKINRFRGRLYLSHVDPYTGKTPWQTHCARSNQSAHSIHKIFDRSYYVKILIHTFFMSHDQKFRDIPPNCHIRKICRLITRWLVTTSAKILSEQMLTYV